MGTISSNISEPSKVEIREPDSVGKEFIEWAEKYWHLEELINIKEPDSFNDEICDYKYMRDIFVDKINSLIKNRLSI